MLQTTRTALTQVLDSLPQIEDQNIPKTNSTQPRREMVFRYVLDNATKTKPLRACNIAEALKLNQATVRRCLRELLYSGQATKSHRLKGYFVTEENKLNYLCAP